MSGPMPPFVPTYCLLTIYVIDFFKISNTLCYLDDTDDDNDGQPDSKDYDDDGDVIWCDNSQQQHTFWVIFTLA